MATRYLDLDGLTAFADEVKSYVDSNASGSSSSSGTGTSTATEYGAAMLVPALVGVGDALVGYQGGGYLLRYCGDFGYTGAEFAPSAWLMCVGGSASSFTVRASAHVEARGLGEGRHVLQLAALGEEAFAAGDYDSAEVLSQASVALGEEDLPTEYERYALGRLDAADLADEDRETWCIAMKLDADGEYGDACAFFVLSVSNLSDMEASLTAEAMCTLQGDGYGEVYAASLAIDGAPLVYEEDFSVEIMPEGDAYSSTSTFFQAGCGDATYAVTTSIDLPTVVAAVEDDTVFFLRALTDGQDAVWRTTACMPRGNFDDAAAENDFVAATSCMLVEEARTDADVYEQEGWTATF